MRVYKPEFIVGFAESYEAIPEKFIKAAVPGAVQLDYQREYKLPDYRYGVNFKDYKWMEDVYTHYISKLNVPLKEHEKAELVFKGIDYRYEIRINGKLLLKSEGMFSEVKLDITEYLKNEAELEVLLYPIPKEDNSDTRSQGRKSCKAVAAYSWDWHPRLVSTGLWDEVLINVYENTFIKDLDLSYRLTDDLSSVIINSDIILSSESKVKFKLIYESETVTETVSDKASTHKISLNYSNPKLWYPHNIGPQNLYKAVIEVLDDDNKVIFEQSKSIGFRRSKLLMNEGSWVESSQFPKSRSDAPASLEINGERIFAKGSNFVNAEIFPSEMTEGKYEELIKLAKNANMNIFRIWGGGFINKDIFFDICDREGVMVWEEFPLACNEYPDDDAYLKILEKEATNIVKKLRVHPCVVLWCGGNELFNNWSKMTDQHHALRLLDSICYKEDRFTPFIMTSPLNGMAHGHYLNYDENTGREFITDLCHSSCTAYTEFGSPSAASAEYIKKYCSKKDYNDLNSKNEVWTEHHAFSAWTENSWLRMPEVNYYFGGYKDTEDLINKTQFLQAMCYKSLFEEMRKQWPHCAMALNWCFNEPWPTFANNSLLSYPATPKPSYFAVKAALRPTLASLRVTKHLFKSGEIFSAEVWMLNDDNIPLDVQNIDVYYSLGNSSEIKLGTFISPELNKRSNTVCGGISFMIPENYNGTIKLSLKVKDKPEYSSEYVYLAKSDASQFKEGMLNI